MATSFTSLLGLALPVTGELAGTWGDTVNNSITALLDSAVAGTTTLSTDADVTLTTTSGSSNQARQAILLCSGARTLLRTITAPARSKIYVVVNSTTGGFGVKIVGAGPTTGVTVAAGKTAVVVWNGSDFVEVAPATATTATNLAGGVAGSLPYQTAASTTTFLGIGAANYVLTSTGTAPTWTINTGTGSVVRATSPTLVTPTLGAASATSVAYALGAAATPSITFTGDLNTGIWSPAADTLAASTAGAERMRIDSAGNVGIGTASPAYKLDVNKGSSGIAARFTASTDNGRGLSLTSSDNGIFLGAIWTSDIASSSGIHAWAINGTERMRIDSAGNMLFAGNAVIGVTSSANSIFIGGAGTLPANVTYQTTSNHIWQVSGTERMRIDSAGNVGIGTASPTERLHVNGKVLVQLSTLDVPTKNVITVREIGISGITGAYNWAIRGVYQYAGGVALNAVGGDLDLIKSINGNTAIATKTDGTPLGYVGIGTITPIGPLDIANSASGLVQITTTNTGAPPGLYARHSRGTLAAPTASLVNDVVGRLNGAGYGTAAYQSCGRFELAAAETLSDTSSAGYARIFTTPTGSVTPLERLRIDSAGNVGIGITPSAWVATGDAIEIGGTGGNYLAFNTTSRSGYIYTNAFYNGVNIYKNNGVATAYGQDVGSHKWFNAPSGTAGATITFTQAMTLDASGNLGIGTITPAEKLHVAGTNTNIRLSGSYAANQSNKIEINNGQTGAIKFAIGMELLSNSGGNYTSSLYTSSATDTRFSFIQAANSVTTFLTSNTERMRINASGDIGIGSTSPDSRLSVSSPLEYAINTLNPTSVANSASGIAFYGLNSTTARQFYAGISATFSNTAGGAQAGALTFDTIDANVVAERMRISSAGNVGIGTASPTTKLDVRGDVNGDSVINSSNVNAGALARGVINCGSTIATATLAANSSAVVATPGLGRPDGIALFTGSTSTGGIDIGARNASGIITFGTGGNTERVRIDAAGNVGIGTTTPGYPLHVSTNINELGGINVSNSNTGALSRSALLANSTSASAILSANGSSWVGSAGQGRPDGVALWTNSLTTGGLAIAARNGAGIITFATGGETERVRITAAGSVGIGTASPGALLDVRGSAIVQAASGASVLTVGTGGVSGNHRVDVLGGGTGTYFGYYVSSAPALVVNTSAGSVLQIGSDGTSTTYQTQAFYTAGAERMRITSAGNVGIGTTTPAGRFDVSGDVIWNTNTAIPGLAMRVGDASSNGANLTADSSGNILFASRVSTVNSERMRITAAGNVGIGTTTPGLTAVTGKELSVSSVAADTVSAINIQGNRPTTGNTPAILAFWNNTDRIAQINAVRGAGSNDGSMMISLATAGVLTERFRIDSAGKVLVGATAARANFNNATFSPRTQIEGVDSTGASLAITCNNASDADGPVLVFGKSATATVGSNTLVANGESLGLITFEGNDGTEFVRAASITCAVDGTPGANDMPGRLVFSTTADGAATSTERMRIDSAGNVGVGTSSVNAQTKVAIAGANRITDARGILSVNSTDSAGANLGGSLSLGGQTGQVIPEYVFGSIAGRYEGSGYSGYLQFATTTSAGAVAERMRIDSAGNVGVGVPSPSVKLDIGGSVYVRGAPAAGALFEIAPDATSGVNGVNLTASFVTGSYGPMKFTTGASERARIDTAGNVGVGTATPRAQMHILGTGQTTAALTDAGARGGMLRVSDASNTFGSGGGILFGNQQGDNANTVGFAAIKGLLETGSNNTAGSLAFSTRANVLDTALTERMRIDTGGNVAIGLSVPGARLHVQAADVDAAIFYRPTAVASLGVILTKSDVGGTNTLVGAGFANGTFGVVSDINKKTNIESARGYLDDLMRVRVVKYNWKTDEEGTPRELGWIAQEVAEIFPGMVAEMDGSKILKKEVFLPMLVKAIQEQQKVINDLNARLTAAGL